MQKSFFPRCLNFIIFVVLMIPILLIGWVLYVFNDLFVFIIKDTWKIDEKCPAYENKVTYMRKSFNCVVFTEFDIDGMYHGRRISLNKSNINLEYGEASKNTLLTYNHGKLEGECIRYKEHKDKAKPQEIYVKGIFKNDLPWEGTFLQEKNSNNVFTNEYWDATRDENYIIVSYTNGCVVPKQVGK